MVTINQRTLLDYFPRESHRELLLSPLIATQTVGQFDIFATVEGGGLSGKARDPRKVERKKIGLKKACKAPQWVCR